MAPHFHRGNARMFKSDIMEALSKVHPATPAIVYLPVTAACLYLAIGVHGVSPGGALWRFGVGYLTWTLTEYWLHRTFFHLEVRGPISERVYFFIHGVHHDYPYDDKRLVMPLAASLMAAGLFFSLFYLLFGVPMMFTYTAGFVFGYVIYDTVHWYTHAGRPKNRFLKFLRRQHMIHHFKEPETRYGVSCPWWDVVFRTTGARADAPDSDADAPQER